MYILQGVHNWFQAVLSSNSVLVDLFKIFGINSIGFSKVWWKCAKLQHSWYTFGSQKMALRVTSLNVITLLNLAVVPSISPKKTKVTMISTLEMQIRHLILVNPSQYEVRISSIWLGLEMISTVYCVSLYMCMVYCNWGNLFFHRAQQSLRVELLFLELTAWYQIISWFRHQKQNLRWICVLSNQALLVGVILFTSSAGGIFPMPPAPVYSASKGGLISFAESISPRLINKGIRVCTLCPQFADTPLVRSCHHLSRVFVISYSSDILSNRLFCFLSLLNVIVEQLFQRSKVICPISRIWNWLRVSCL